MMLQQKQALDHTSVIFLWCCVFVSCADVYLLKNENKLFKHLQPLGISPSPIAVSEESGSLFLCLAPFFKLAFVSRMFDSVYRCTVRYITDLSSLFDLFCKVQERKTWFFFGNKYWPWFSQSSWAACCGPFSNFIIFTLPAQIKHLIYTSQFTYTQGSCSGCVFTICFDSDNHSKTGWSKLHSSPQLHSLFGR